MTYLRIAGAVVVVALLGFLWWRVSLSFSQGEQLEQQQGQIDRLWDARVRDTRIAVAIDTFRGQQFDFAKAFRDAIASSPITHEVPHVDPKTGATSTCVERIPARYRELFNSAVTGAAAPGVP